MKRDAMVFPFRWARSLAYLDDADFRRMFAAIIDYAENGEEPQFKGVMAALWRELKASIDEYFEEEARAEEEAEMVRNARREAGRKGAEFGKLGGRPKNPKEPLKGFMETPKTPQGVLETPNNPLRGFENPSPSKKETEKESTPQSPLKEKDKERITTGAHTREEKVSFIESSLKPTADYVKWSEEQFRRSVSAAVEKHLEYKPCVEDFSRYWLEPDRRGKYRFALEKTWSTAGRLATWYQRQLQRGGIPQTTPGGWHRDPKTGIVTGTGDEESYAEWKRNGGF